MLHLFIVSFWIETHSFYSSRSFFLSFAPFRAYTERSRTTLQCVKRNECHNMNYAFVCEKYMCMFYSNWTKRVEADKSSARSSQLNTHTLVTLAIVCRDMAFANATPKTLYQKSIFTLFLFLHTEFALKTIENHYVDNNHIQQRRCIHVAAKAATVTTAAAHARRVKAIW